MILLGLSISNSDFKKNLSCIIKIIANKIVKSSIT